MSVCMLHRFKEGFLRNMERKYGTIFSQNIATNVQKILSVGSWLWRGGLYWKGAIGCFTVLLNDKYNTCIP